MKLNKTSNRYKPLLWSQSNCCCKVNVLRLCLWSVLLLKYELIKGEGILNILNGTGNMSGFWEKWLRTGKCGLDGVVGGC